MEPPKLNGARKASLDALLERLGIKASPSRYPQLHQALVHRSWAVENGAQDNERLEFLGDSVINLITAEYLFEMNPDASEGDLSKLRASMVSRRILGQLAQDLGLGELLLLGIGEESSGGRQRSTNLGSALEAICGALHQTCPWNELRDSLRKQVVEPAMNLATGKVLVDYKSRLQEWTQKEFQEVPSYRVTSSTGPDHRKEFAVEVLVAGELLATGRGGRKKWAENDAARIALEKIEEGWSPPTSSQKDTEDKRKRRRKKKKQEGCKEEG